MTIGWVSPFRLTVFPDFSAFLTPDQRKYWHDLVLCLLTSRRAMELIKVSWTVFARAGEPYLRSHLHRVNVLPSLVCGVQRADLQWSQRKDGWQRPGLICRQLLWLSCPGWICIPATACAFFIERHILHWAAPVSLRRWALLSSKLGRLLKWPRPVCDSWCLFMHCCLWAMIYGASSKVRG